MQLRANIECDLKCKFNVRKRRLFLKKEWITVKELADIQGISPRAVRKAVNQNKYVTRLVDCKGGTKYEILVRSLNDNTQNLIDFEKSKNEIEKADWGQRVAGLLQASRNSFIAPNQANREPSLRKNQTIPTHAYQVALSRFDLVSLWNDYKHSSKNKTEAGKEFLSEYNKGSLYPVIFNVLGKVSSGTIYRWNKALVGTQDYTKLIPAYDYGEKESNPKLTKEEELVFKNFLLSPNKTNIGKATKLTKFILKKQGIERIC